jgi:hypothetical protein
VVRINPAYALGVPPSEVVEVLAQSADVQVNVDVGQGHVLMRD